MRLLLLWILREEERLGVIKESYDKCLHIQEQHGCSQWIRWTGVACHFPLSPLYRPITFLYPPLPSNLNTLTPSQITRLTHYLCYSLLFTITLVFTSIHLHRHRKAGGHCMPGSSSPTSGSLEAGHGYGAPSIATTAVEAKESEMEGTGTHVTQSTYTHTPSQPMQPAQPMGVAGQGQGFGGQPAYA